MKKENLLSNGLVLGIILGAIITFFSAPQKGQITQKKLAQKSNSFIQEMIIKIQNILIDMELLLNNKDN